MAEDEKAELQLDVNNVSLADRENLKLGEGIYLLQIIWLHIYLNCKHPTACHREFGTFTQGSVTTLPLFLKEKSEFPRVSDFFKVFYGANSS